VNRRLWVGVVAASLLFGLFTTYVHAITLGKAYLEEGGTEITAQRAILDGVAGNPLQYRVLTVYLWVGLLQAFAALGLPHHIYLSFVGLRIAEDTAIFVLAFAYYRALGLSTANGFIALSLLAWGMSYGNRNSDLRFDTYLDVAFYLLAALCILRERYLVVVALMALAALNRETSGLIPVLLLAHFLARSRRREGRFRLESREALIVSAAFAVYAAVFVAVRLAYPAQALVIPHGSPPGLPLFLFNVSEWLTWVQLFAVLGILPVLAVFGYRYWPMPLRVFAFSLVPMWVVIHSFAAVMAESRLFLVPQALVIVPGAMFLAQSGTGGREPRLEDAAR
jgi:hypothetical protein